MTNTLPSQFSLHKSASITAMVLLFTAVLVCGQDPLRFSDEVTQLNKRLATVNTKNVILFTGSSSIRLWKNLEQTFPEHHVINTGFGGSHMSDLYYFMDSLILRFDSKSIFIYEGDNDLAQSEKSTERILEDAGKILKRIRCESGKKTKVFFITPKPSILRWELKEKYESYITKLKAWAEENENVSVIDVWNPMLGKEGDVRNDLFVDDNLHMNEKGYAIWADIIKQYLE